MNTSARLIVGAEIALIATTILSLVAHELWIAAACVAVATASVVVVSWVACAARHPVDDNLAVGVGTVINEEVVDDEYATTGESQIWIEVSSVHGDSFIGRLMRAEADPDLSTLRPGLVMLVAFDPTAREELSLPDDMLAVRASALAVA